MNITKQFSMTLFSVFLLTSVVCESVIAKTPDSFEINKSAFSEVKTALKQSQRDEKYGVLVIFGDDDCQDCMSFLDEVTVERDLAESIFEVVTLPSRDANKAEMGFYPNITQFPHFYVLTPLGDLLWSQKASVLKTDDEFDDSKIDKFLNYWLQSSLGKNYVSDRYSVAGAKDITPPWCGPNPKAPCIRR